MIAYITEQGAKIKKEGKRIIVACKEKEHSFFSWELEQMLIFGNITLTQPALSLLINEQVDVSFFRADGRYMARIVSEEAKNVFLRKKQFILSDNQEFCLKIAKNIVQGKILNQAMILNRIKREKNKPELEQAVQSLRFFAKDIVSCNNMERLRGIEGIATAEYFRGFAHGFHHEWKFEKRVKRPPTDPVNVVLSLTYMLLYNRMYTAIRQAQLDPYPGVLHSLAYGRFSLALDLMEEFRPLVADLLPLALFNLKMLKALDFTSAQEMVAISDDKNIEAELSLENPFAQEKTEKEELQESSVIQSLERTKKQCLILKNEAYKKVLSAFSKKIETRFLHPLTNKEMTYNEAMFFQAKQYRKVIENEYEEYCPLLLR